LCLRCVETLPIRKRNDQSYHEELASECHSHAIKGAQPGWVN
jgi:hypothetical protein